MTLDGRPVFAVDGGRSLRQTFTLRPTYLVDVGSYEPGELIDATTASHFERLPFTPPPPDLVATLDPHNAWTLTRTAP